MILRPSERAYAHIDSNSFFASCEVLRDPRLKGRAVCVGDEIVIAASYEAKSKGIKTGTPFWEASKMLGSALVKIRPDHAFYRSVSDRFMEYLRSRFGKIEVFSVDECFADLSLAGFSAWDGWLADFAETLKFEIRKEVGLPVSIGISNTRLRAKMFADLKKPFGSVVEFDRNEIDAIFESLPVREIPYIASGNSARLWAGVKTALDFVNLRPGLVKSLLGKNGFELWLELNGVDVWVPRDVAKLRKSITSTRSFNREKTSDRSILWRRVMENAERAYGTLFSERQAARTVGLHFRTDDFSPVWHWVDLGEPTIDYRKIVSALKAAFLEAFDPRETYRTTGVGFGEITPFLPKQMSVFDLENRSHENDERLALAISTLKNRYGASVLNRGFCDVDKRSVSLEVWGEAR